MNLQEHRRKVLGKLGFVKKGGTKHERWILMDDGGKPLVTTRVSRNHRDIGPTLRRLFCGELHVSKEQYLEIASCNMSKTDYYNHLLNNGII